MSKEPWVLDASALLAAIHNEKGGDYVQQHIEQCVINTVNWSEVIQKLDRAEVNTTKIQTSLKALGLHVVDFIEEDAELTAKLWPKTKTLGLSLSDRACLATAKRFNTKVITADRAWKALVKEQSIQLIR